jgi:K+-sensing histidine kinase KdpD
MLYPLAILIASFRFGRGPSIVASASVATYDFFCAAVLHQRRARAARADLSMMFASLAVSSLTSRTGAGERGAAARGAHGGALRAEP